ncbi:MAG: hypothetical protein MUE69_23355 [Myxococcota bacterium]|nr:hypothetical protein [Myxococcota bacterium]
MRTLLFVLAVVTSLPLFAQDAAEEEATESDLPGVYRLSTPNDRAQALIDEAIDTGVESMGPLRRSVGRRRLRAKNEIRRELEIAFTGERVAIRYDRDRYEVRRNVRETVTLPDGERVQLRATVEGPRLVLDWKTDDGERRDSFMRRADGTLVFGVTVTSEQLPTPVRYRLVYRAR